jgi:glycosyltransferase involved in cell wall biosynthesis
MKICWLLPSDNSGGISPVALSCCRQAAKAGHKTTMLLLTEPTWITSNDFRVASLGLYARVPETPAILLQWLKDNPQDVVFFNSCSEFDPVIPYLPSTTKCVYVAHDAPPSAWRPGLEEEDNLEAIVAVSETVASKFRHLLKQPHKLSVICNGTAFPQKPDINVERQDDLIFLGGDNLVKGSLDVLNLWKQLVKQEFKGNLHWFGNLDPKFKAKIERLPNSKRIQVYGHVQRELIFSTAASAKVLLMLSHFEAFGMSTVEAMSMGCVPVAWDVDSGTKEIATPNKTGLFAPLGNKEALATQVLYACENYQAFSAAVIERVRSEFDETIMWQGYESLINQIAKLEPIARSKQGQQPPAFKPPFRRFQLLPPSLRSTIREFIGRSPILSYWLNDLHGW